MAALTGVSATGGAGTVTPVITIALTGVSASGRIGIIGKDERPGDVLALVTPLPQLSLVGDSPELGALILTLPAPQLALTGVTASVGALAMTAPMPQLALAGSSDVVGTLRMQLPAPQLVLDGGASLALALPVPALAFTATQDTRGAINLRTPVPQLALTGTSPIVGALALRMPTPALSLTGSTDTAGRLQIAIPTPVLSLSGSTEVHGQLALALPMPKLQLVGTFAAVGVLAMPVPMPVLQLVGSSELSQAQSAAVRTTFALQTERLALTQYTNFPFNSFAVFNGRFLGASEDGIFELVGDTDAGTAIDARVATGVTDMATSHVKRVDRLYVGFRAAGNMQVWVTVNEGQQRGYRLAKPEDNKLHGGHVRLGKGVEARYWQFELRNEGGADFTLDTLEVKPTITPRRVGQNDA